MDGFFNQGLPSVRASSSMLYTILKNIIENGIKFNDTVQPTVTLSSKMEKSKVKILIRDNGIGIDSKYEEEIFGMFKRLHHRTLYKGSGIGLAIVKLLIEKNEWEGGD